MWLSFVACIFLLDSDSIVGVCSSGGGLSVMGDSGLGVFLSVGEEKAVCWFGGI